MGFDWDKEETTVNHSKEFRKATNPNVHTNGIEAKWRHVKRQLPSSGRYEILLLITLFKCIFIFIKCFFLQLFLTFTTIIINVFFHIFIYIHFVLFSK